MIYPYECTECGHKDDIEMKITDDHPLTIECPICKKITLKRIFTSGRFILSDAFKEDNKINYGQSPSGRKRYW